MGALPFQIGVAVSRLLQGFAEFRIALIEKILGAAGLKQPGAVRVLCLFASQAENII